MKVQLLVLSLLSFAVTSAWADVLTIGANHDTTLFQNNVSNSSGGGPGLFAGTNGATSPRRALISFDLSGIPAGATITGVQLTLTVGQIAGSGGSGGISTRTIGLFAITSPWGEGTVQSGSTSIGGTGQGFTANPGDATWNSAFNQQIAWQNPGGDFNSTASASLTLTNATPGTSFTWLSTSQLVADVQGWLTDPSKNYGWELINADETDATTFDAFYSREALSVPGVTASQLPSLQITYTASTVPEPACSALMATALLGMAAARPRRRRA
jgi:hypothetical protein